MQVVWCIGAMRHFGELIAEVLGWPLYVDCPIGDVDTVYIIGMYDIPDYEFTLACTARANRRIIHWCGSDVSHMTRPEMLPDATHLCETQGLRDELLEHGIDATVCTFPTKHHVDPLPLPDEPVVSFYAGSDAEKYGASVVRFLQSALPEAKFIVYSLGQYDDLTEVILRSRVHVRFTNHDGSANSCREMMEAGRRVVCTADLPFARRVSKANPIHILREVRAALKEDSVDTEASDYYKGVNAADHFRTVFAEVIA